MARPSASILMILFVALAAFSAGATDSLKPGTPDLKSASQLTFGPEGILFVGVSNEEFSSDMRSIPFPFKNADKGTGLRIWHSAHGRYETAAPVRTFVHYTIDKQQFILASYSCNPLVKILVSQFKLCGMCLGNTTA